jgi:hypothetical protein
VFDFIPRHILSVFCKLDAESVVRTPVESGDESLNDEPGAKLHIGEFRHHMGEEVARITLLH